MSGRLIEKISHSCGTSDALQIFEEKGKYTGYCFACSTYIPSPYEGKSSSYQPKRIQKKPKEIEAELRAIDKLPVCALPERKLTTESLDRFGVKVSLSEQDGVTPVLHHYPYFSKGTLIAYKTRILENKKMWITGGFKEVNLFGWQQALNTGAKRLFITEGELDAISLFQALKDKTANTKWANYDPAVVSLTSGASSVKHDLTRYLTDITRNFKEIVFVFDEDEAGNKAKEQAVQIISHGQVATLPAKDPNECLMEGRNTALCAAVLFKTNIPKNTRLVWGQHLVEAAREQAQWGMSWPWGGLTQLTRGIRYGETYYLGAGVKMGKSEIVNTIATHLMIEHNLKVFLAKPEEANRKTVQMVFGKVVGKLFHDPTVEFDYDAYDKAAKIIGDKLCMLSLYQHVGWETLRNDILVATQLGCKAVFIDPISNLVNGIPSSEKDTVLQSIAQDLAALAKDLDIVVFIFCHLKAPLTGEPHERGGKVYSTQFTGSRAMMRSCNLMLGLEGNKDPDLELEERNMRRLIILEDREFGATGIVHLYWDWKSGLFSEINAP